MATNSGPAPDATGVRLGATSATAGTTVAATVAITAVGATSHRPDAPLTGLGLESGGRGGNA